MAAQGNATPTFRVPNESWIQGLSAEVLFASLQALGSFQILKSKIFLNLLLYPVNNSSCTTAYLALWMSLLYTIFLSKLACLLCWVGYFSTLRFTSPMLSTRPKHPRFSPRLLLWIMITSSRSLCETRIYQVHMHSEKLVSALQIFWSKFQKF